VLEKPALREIFVPKMEESRGKWSRVRNEELNDLHSSTNIIPVIKSRMRWVGHVARMWQGRDALGLLVGTTEGK
jgi:hypothetical protein